MCGRLAGEIWPKHFSRSFLSCWLLENADDSVQLCEKTWGQCSAPVLYGYMATTTDKDGCVGLAKNCRHTAQNRPAFENDGHLDT